MWCFSHSAPNGFMEEYESFGLLGAKQSMFSIFVVAACAPRDSSGIIMVSACKAGKQLVLMMFFRFAPSAPRDSQRIVMVSTEDYNAFCVLRLLPPPFECMQDDNDFGLAGGK